MSVEGITIISPSSNFSLSSLTFLATLAFAIIVSLPTPTFLNKSSLTIWTFKRFVLPETPTGTPAVITTKSPFSIKPLCSALATVHSIISSVDFILSIFIGYTPQYRDIFRITRSLSVAAIIGAIGLNLETEAAVNPDDVAVIIAVAFK
ncbi:hypothetical protein SDC9_192991 [bioreactor metagenome]|uniref:Uncharacterized protein n=1 Tax=bioreactor metagenome TaxID=1076179 RepID=A0A645IAS0_9ZZZZ